MDPKSYGVIEDFVKTFEKVAEVIRDRNPDCILAPMVGAVPFIDILNVVDDEFPNDKVEYVPASNKVHKLRDVLRGTFENIIDAYAPNGGEFLSIDEVVSGNSLLRVYKQFDAALTNYANKKTMELYGPNTDFTKEEVKKFRDSVKESIKYNTIGIVDSKMERLGKAKNKEYESLVGQGTVIPIETKCIVTMDRTEYFPVTYKKSGDSEGKTIFLPVIDNFQVSPAYIDLLTTVSDILGKDSSDVTVRNLAKIRQSYKWVPEQLRST